MSSSCTVDLTNAPPSTMTPFFREVLSPPTECLPIACLSAGSLSVPGCLAAAEAEMFEVARIEIFGIG